MRRFIVAACLLALAACGVKHDKLPDKVDDPALKTIADKLNDQDKALLVGYLMRRTMAQTLGGGPLVDQVKTVGDALDAQKKWQADQTQQEAAAAQLKLEAEAKRKAVADQINQEVTVALVNTSFQPSNFESGIYDDYENFSFAVKNNSNRVVKGLKGVATWTDTFGDVYASVPMEFEQDIPAGSTKDIDLSKKINKFEDSDQKIVALDNTKKFSFAPTQIVFSDGTSLKAPDDPAS